MEYQKFSIFTIKLCKFYYNAKCTFVGLRVYWVGGTLKKSISAKVKHIPGSSLCNVAKFGRGNC